MASQLPVRIDADASEARAEEQTLVARVRVGDHAAFETLFRRYYGQLCDFAVRYVQVRGDAEDLVHDVFLRIWERRAEWEVHVDVSTYLYGATRNRALNSLKRRITEQQWRRGEGRTEDSYSLGDAACPTVLNEAEERLATEAIDTAIERAIADLPSRCRMALALRWQRQMSYAEIAETMGISIKTVELYMTRGHKALRAAYQALQDARE